MHCYVYPSYIVGLRSCLRRGVEIYGIMRRLYIQNLHTGTTFNAGNTVKHKLVETYDNTHDSP